MAEVILLLSGRRLDFSPLLGDHVLLIWFNGVLQRQNCVARLDELGSLLALDLRLDLILLLLLLLPGLLGFVLLNLTEHPLAEVFLFLNHFTLMKKSI